MTKPKLRPGDDVYVLIRDTAVGVNSYGVFATWEGANDYMSDFTPAVQASLKIVVSTWHNE
jgi:hypothetical protein